MQIDHDVAKVKPEHVEWDEKDSHFSVVVADKVVQVPSVTSKSSRKKSKKHVVAVEQEEPIVRLGFAEARK